MVLELSDKALTDNMLVKPGQRPNMLCHTSSYNNIYNQINKYFEVAS